MKISHTQSRHIIREKQTVSTMIAMYCRHHHGIDSLCEECTQLEAYAHMRLDRCPHTPLKPSCRRCPIHCYNADMRQRMQTIMRWSGPRMMWHHPLMAIRHLLDEMKR